MANGFVRRSAGDGVSHALALGWVSGRAGSTVFRSVGWLRPGLSPAQA